MYLSIPPLDHYSTGRTKENDILRFLWLHGTNLLNASNGSIATDAWFSVWHNALKIAEQIPLQI